MGVDHTIRTKDGGTKAVKDFTRGIGIKAFCTACLGYKDHPDNCTTRTCELYPFRGKTTLAFHADDVANEKVEKEQVEGDS